MTRHVSIVAAALAALAASNLACAPHVAEVYNWRPDREPPPTLPASAEVQLIDISRDPADRYEFVRGRLPPNEVVGRFNAIHRAGPTLGPLVDELRGFARQRGADVVIVNCKADVVDGQDALVCAGMLVRTERAGTAE
jgi:hypothetical protein